MQLARIEAINHELAVIATVEEAVDVRDKAAALKNYLKISGASLEMQNRCAEIKVRAERRAGEILSEDPDFGRGKKSTKAADFGLDLHETSRFQRFAAVPVEKFDAFIEEQKAEGELTTASVLRFERQLNAEPRAEKPIVFETLMDRIRSAVEWAAENCQPEDIPALQSYVRSLAKRIPQMAEPVSAGS